jgi:hypothetical protein
LQFVLAFIIIKFTKFFRIFTGFDFFCSFTPIAHFLHLKTTNARPGQWLTFSVTSGKPKNASNEEILRKRFGLG